MSLIIEFASEQEITVAAHRELAKLLNCSFPNIFEARTYFKQLPHHRLIAKNGERTVGQMGIDHRIIRVGDEIVSIAGVIDLCVMAEVTQPLDPGRSGVESVPVSFC